MTELVSGRDFYEFVTSYRYTAFRLEVRDRYNMPSEAEPVRRFLGGEPDDDAWMDDWTGMVLRRTLAGQRMERVRVVTEPWSGYTRFGIHLSRLNVAAGEDIRYLERDHARQMGLPDYDFWLIDARAVGLMRFGDDDVLLGAEVVDDPAVVAEHCRYREVARFHAVPRAAYITSKA